MKVRSSEIRQKLNDIWPDLEYIWLWDNTFWMPKSSVLQPLLDQSKIPKMEFVNSFNDCDNFALQFLAESRRKRYMQWKQGNLPEDSKFPISIGFAFGNMFRGQSKLHAVNVCVCPDGVYIIDTIPSENRLWKADKANDNILFVFM